MSGVFRNKLPLGIEILNNHIMNTVNIIPATTGSTYAKLGKAVWVKTTSGNTYRYLDGNKVSTEVFNEAVKNLPETECFKHGQHACPSGKIKIWN